jgi:hypothetical protein
MSNYDKIKDTIIESTLQRFKPSKHQKAYKFEKKIKKRCYAR